MSETTTGNGDGATTVAPGVSPAIAEPPREKLTKKAITADLPTWCPGCGDFAVLASFYKALEKRHLAHEKTVTPPALPPSSPFPHSPTPLRPPSLHPPH